MARFARLLSACRIDSHHLKWLAVFMATGLTDLFFPGLVLAERADRDKPIHLESDRATVEDATKASVFTGNVVFTQGTLVIHADKMIMKEDSRGFRHATAFGNPVSFRQKQDGKDEYIEGWSEQMEYDSTTDRVQLFKKARMKRNQDEVRGDYILYDATSEFFQVMGNREGNAKAGESITTGGRVKAVIQPKKRPQQDKGK